jgi:N-acetylglucosaminyldiphosphoundecaprenol N-acetyl-beta-D-mannosaminyltransferase
MVEALKTRVEDGRRIELLGLPLDLVTLEESLERIALMLRQPGPHQVVTINPEAIIRCQDHPDLPTAIREAELVVADGVGILWAVSQLTPYTVPERVAGADLIPALFKRFGPKLRVYFLGAKPGIAEKAAERSRQKYGIQVVGVHDGYFQDEAAVVAAIRQAQPDLLLVGMGERQDTFIHRNKARLGAKVAIGVGGMLDVLSGEVKRVHPIAQKLKIEWLLRVALDRKRWNRAPRLWKFVQLVRNTKRHQAR